MEPIREREARLGACSGLEASEVQGASRGRLAHDGPATSNFLGAHSTTINILRQRPFRLHPTSTTHSASGLHSTSSSLWYHITTDAPKQVTDHPPMITFAARHRLSIVSRLSQRSSRGAGERGRNNVTTVAVTSDPGRRLIYLGRQALRLLYEVIGLEPSLASNA
jgi:hypothetical protein